MKKGKEQIDISQLPPVTETISSVIFNFETNDKRLKLIESFYKMPEKELKMISREEIIQFAKEQKIYVDPAEGKKPAKGEPPIEHKPITSQELAKAAKLLIEENSVQYRKNKKELLDNIENLKKQKEEAIAYWAAQAEAVAKDPKKKPDKKTPPKPEEIIIPEAKEYDLEYLVVLNNYPLNSEEFIEMEKENIILNNIREIKEVADYVPPEDKALDSSMNADKKGAPPKKAANAPKDAGKPVNDAQILKNFYEPTTLNPEYTPENIYNTLHKAKMTLGSGSKMRNCLFDKAEFSFRTLDDPKKTYYNVYQEEFINSMRELNEFLFYYKKWFEMHKFQEVGTPINDFSLEKIKQFLNNNDFYPKDLEHDSVGNNLIAYFKSRSALEEEEKRINAERELEKLKREEEEKKQKIETEEEQKKETEKKDTKKTSTGKKTSVKEIPSKPDEGKGTQQGEETGEEKVVEDEVDTEGVNELNQLFENLSDEIVKEFDNPPLEENIKIEENEKIEEQKIEEGMNISQNKIPEENSNIHQSNEGMMEGGQEEEGQEEYMGEEGNMENIENISELESDHFQMNENMQKQAEDLLQQGSPNEQVQNQEENNLEVNDNKNKEENKEEEKKEEENQPKEQGASKVIIEKENEESAEASQLLKDQQHILQDKAATLNQNFDQQNLMNDIENIKNENQDNIKEEPQEKENEKTNEMEENNKNPEQEGNNEVSPVKKSSMNNSENQGEIEQNIELEHHDEMSQNENNQIQNEIDDNATENLDYERLIINENDEMMKNSLESKNDQNYLYHFEKSLNKSRAIPGIYRPPTLSPMEENLRKAVRAKVYPFLPQDVSIPIYEKYNLIHKFEECMKGEIPEREFDFSNRVYQENLSHDILTQRISKLLLYSPEVKTFYNENTDNMLLMLYYNIPKERVFRKYNKYRYLSKPDFDNWVKVFKPVFELKKAKDKQLEEEKKEESQQQEAANPNASQMAAQPEKEQPPAENNASAHQEGSMHEGNGTALESIMPGSGKKVVNPYIKLFQPLDTVFSDPLYISSDTYIGVVKEKIKYMFPSDNGLFIKKIIENGIFSSYSSFIIKDDIIFGIRKDTSKNTEFWYRYDMQGTGLSISKNEEGKIFTNLTFVNGLNLQILPNGEVSQRLEGKNNYRIITSKASIIEYVTDEKNHNENKSMNIYYANGNFSEIKDGKIRNINNKGFQTEKNLSNGEINILAKIPVTVQMDIESQTSTMIREDGVIQIKYSDNSLLTIHKDTTKIFTEVPDKNNNFKYMIEHDEYCTINVYISGESREYDEKIPEIIKNLSYKSKDGIIYEVVCPDRNRIYVFKDTSDNAIILIMNIDGGIIKIDPNNEEVIILSPSEVAKFGEDKNGLDGEIFAEKNSHKAGTYNVDFANGRIFTVDDEQNLFEIYDDGYANCKLYEDPNKVITEENQEQEQNNENKENKENKDASIVNNDSKAQEVASPQKGTEPNAEEEENKNNTPKKESNALERPPSPDYEKLNEENIEPEKKPKKPPQNQNQAANANNNPQPVEKKPENLNKSNIKSNNNVNNANNNQEGENNEEEVKEEEIIPPPTKNFIMPRLFVVENDNSGYELLSEEQIQNYKKLKKEDILHCKYISQVLTDDYTSHSWITKYFSIADGIKETHHIHNIQIPETLNKFCHLPKESQFVSKEIYFYRNLIESKYNYDAEFRNKIKEAIETSNKHFEKKSLEWYFGTNMNREESKNNFEEHQRLLTNILNERQTSDVKFDYEDIRKKNPIKKNYIELKENTSALFDIKKYVKEKEDKKIREDLNFRIYPLNLRLTSPTEIEAIVNGINVVPPKAGKTKTDQRNIPQQKRLIPIESHAEREVKFYPNYFESEKGLEYLKENPHQKYVDPKEKNKQQVNVEEERDNISKAQNLLDKAREDYEQQRLYPNGDINANNIHFGNDVDINNKNNSPVVYLNDGPQNQKSTMPPQGMGLPPRVRGSGRKVLPSIYKQTQILNRINDEYNVQKAREWVESKTMKYTVDGNLRKQNPLVPQYIKPTFPQAEFNEDYIYIDKLTEPRVKTSSVSNRVYFNAPSVEEIRKSGQHDLLIEAIENRRTPEEMMERLNLMITGELCDPLNKQLKIDPVSLDFGLLCQGKTYQMYIKLRNDDNMTNRVMVRNGNKKNYITIENFVGGKVVPGETKKVKVVLRADEEIVGKFNEILEITTKSFIYKIPVKAYIVKPDEYDEKRFGHLKGREPYTKSYPASDAKYKCDPVKIVLPKIRELEEKEKKKLEGTQGYNGSISGVEGDMNANNQNEDEKGNEYTSSLPPI